MISTILKKVLEMTKKERLIRLCNLSAKQYNNSLEIDEMLELAAIQSIREANGEIEEVKRVNALLD